MKIKNNKINKGMNIMIDKNDLDEMQRQIKNKIGHQMFIVVVVLLLIDLILNGAEIRLLEYPINIIIIMATCLYVYVNRLIVSGAYINDKNFKKVLISLVIAAVLNIFGVIDSFHNSTLSHDAKMLLRLVWIGTVITIIVLILKKLSEKKSE